MTGACNMPTRWSIVWLDGRPAIMVDPLHRGFTYAGRVDGFYRSVQQRSLWATFRSERQARRALMAARLARGADAARVEVTRLQQEEIDHA